MYNKMEVERMKVAKEFRLAQIRKIYELLIENFRTTITDISEELGITQPTARNRMNEAFDEGYISKPKVRKNSYLPFREHV